MTLPFGAMRYAYCTLQQPDIHTLTVRNWHTTDRRYITPMIGFRLIAVIVPFIVQPYFARNGALAFFVRQPFIAQNGSHSKCR